MYQFRVFNNTRRQHFNFNNKGVSLIEALVVVAIVGVLAVIGLQIVRNQQASLKYLRAAMTRDLLRFRIEYAVLNVNSLYQSANAPDNAALKNCLVGGGTSLCSATLAGDFKLVDRVQNSNYFFSSGTISNPISYDINGMTCTSGSTNCMFTVATSYRASCSGGAASCAFAESLAIHYEINFLNNTNQDIPTIRKVVGDYAIALPAPCNIPWGGQIANTSSVTAYLNPSPPYGTSCTTETRTCLNGVLSGTAVSQSCTPQAPANCTTPWGSTVNHGSSATAYQAPSVPSGNSCSSQTRSCNNGTLSGTYAYNSCSVLPPPPPPSGTYQPIGVGNGPGCSGLEADWTFGGKRGSPCSPIGSYYSGYNCTYVNGAGSQQYVLVCQ